LSLLTIQQHPRAPGPYGRCEGEQEQEDGERLQVHHRPLPRAGAAERARSCSSMSSRAFTSRAMVSEMLLRIRTVSSRCSRLYVLVEAPDRRRPACHRGCRRQVTGTRPPQLTPS